MKRIAIKQKTSIAKNTSYEGETIEKKIARMLNNKEPIGKDNTELIYEERGKGIDPNTDIRTDRWEHAVEEATNLAKSTIARREHKKKLGEVAKENMEKEKKSEDKNKETGGQSTEATK